MKKPELVELWIFILFLLIIGFIVLSSIDKFNLDLTITNKAEELKQCQEQSAFLQAGLDSCLGGGK